jgi:hypothetical protein
MLHGKNKRCRAWYSWSVENKALGFATKTLGFATKALGFATKALGFAMKALGFAMAIKYRN